MNDWRVIQSAPTILGLHIQPIQVGHLFVFYEAKSPLYPYENLGGETDALLMGALALNMSGSEAVDWAKGGFQSKLTRKFKRTVRGSNPDDELARLWRHIEEGIAHPEIKKSQKGSPIGVPFHWVLMARLVALGVSMDAALDYTVKSAGCLLLANAELEGNVQTVTDKDREFRAWCEEMDRNAIHGNQ